MKDKQIALTGGEPRIFLVSALLHCVSMSALVYLRSSFGFSFLRPKSVFFALSWAFGLYAIYAWFDGEVWHRYYPLLLFGIGAFALYWVHLGVALLHEWNQTGEHDQYSGTSHALRLMQLATPATSSPVEAKIHLWGEPPLALLAACLVWVLCASRELSAWLFFASTCLWIKEGLNHWYRIRSRKRREDVFGDTEDAIAVQSNSDLDNASGHAVRKAKVNRPRIRDEGEFRNDNS